MVNEHTEKMLALERAGVRKNVIEGVHLVGLQAINRVGSKPPYRYTEEALKAAVHMYDNVDVYVNHGDKTTMRAVEHKIGYITNPSYRDGKGVFGDIVLNEKHAVTEAMLWWAANKPDKIGMSHVASTEYNAVENAMTAINAVHSVDLVHSGSTTKGLFMEGVISDKIDSERMLGYVLDTAWSLIYESQYRIDPKPLTQADRAVKMVPVIEDLLAEVKKLAKTTTTESTSSIASAKESGMEIKDLTIDQLKKERKDLVSVLAKEAVDAHVTFEAAVADAVKDIDPKHRSKVFMKQVREAVAANDTAAVAEIVADRKTVTATTVAEAKDEPVIGAVQTGTQTKEVAESKKTDTKKKVTIDDVVAEFNK